MRWRTGWMAGVGDMTPSSAQASAESRPRLGVVRERLANAKSEWLAGVLDKDDSWVRKLRNGECGILLADLPALLKALGLKTVDIHKTCIDPDIARAYEVIARRMVAERSLLMEDAE